MRTRISLILSLLGCSLGAGQFAWAQGARDRELEYLRQELPPVPYFEQWLKKTGELPPDFSRLPFYPNSPPLLTTERDGRLQAVSKAPPVGSNTIDRFRRGPSIGCNA